MSGAASQGRGVVAIDVGGTRTRVAAGDGPVVRFPTEQDYDRQLARLRDAIPGTPSAVGVSFGGRVTAAGDVRVAMNLRGYEGRPLRRDLESTLDAPVRVAHDATCGLLGEHALGSLRGTDRCGYVTLSTGVGAALRLGAGGHFVAATTEAGHQLVAGNDRRCGCGQTGCLETLLGGAALGRHLGRALETVEDAGFWHAYARHLADGIANFALTAGLDAVAVGGAIAAQRAGLWPPLREALAERLTYQAVRVHRATLDEAPLAGARVLLDVPPSSILH
ncbi:ROK family protein [Dactylosporangium siamense]|uniref:Glucokinase n=1 Tax=Dactylosporangium siamense TaxID=685454 RepID=A0A919PX69_9ACTN|nr:ROK family protein [Dactylosporangium siamense]GIG50148.1 glucokinase [Dactylosporangium siamense]